MVFGIVGFFIGSLSLEWFNLSVMAPPPGYGSILSPPPSRADPTSPIWRLTPDPNPARQRCPANGCGPATFWLAIWKRPRDIWNEVYGVVEHGLYIMQTGKV